MNYIKKKYTYQIDNGNFNLKKIIVLINFFYKLLYRTRKEVIKESIFYVEKIWINNKMKKM